MIVPDERDHVTDLFATVFFSRLPLRRCESWGWWEQRQNIFLPPGSANPRAAIELYVSYIIINNLKSETSLFYTE